LASSIENFGVDGEEEDEIEVEEIEQIYVETRNERRILTVESNSSEAANANDIRVEIVENETEDSNSNKENTNIESNRSSELLNEKINEIIASNVEPIVVENSQLNVIPSPKIVHHINTSIAPFQSTLMNDFDNQYLWDYSDNNKFQKF
jgi:TATA-binding protein-associated factor Taf7